MFNKKMARDIDDIMERILSLERDANIARRSKTCEECGCLVDSSKAAKGNGEIRERVEYSPISFGVRRVEYIYYPYYCMIHAPKGE